MITVITPITVIIHPLRPAITVLITVITPITVIVHIMVTTYTHITVIHDIITLLLCTYTLHALPCATQMLQTQVRSY